MPRVPEVKTANDSEVGCPEVDVDMDMGVEVWMWVWVGTPRAEVMQLVRLETAPAPAD